VQTRDRYHVEYLETCVRAVMEVDFSPVSIGVYPGTLEVMDYEGNALLYLNTDFIINRIVSGLVAMNENLFIEIVPNR
jgi:hypothetical protein